MPETKPGSKTLEGILSDNNYPSSVDDMVRSDTPFEGTETSLPEESPIGSGSVPISSVKKTR